MLKDEMNRISVAKMGHYKKTLADVQRWQITSKGQKPPFIQFLHWLFGN